MSKDIEEIATECGEIKGWSNERIKAAIAEIKAQGRGAAPILPVQKDVLDLAIWGLVTLAGQASSERSWMVSAEKAAQAMGFQPYTIASLFRWYIFSAGVEIQQWKDNLYGWEPSLIWPPVSCDERGVEYVERQPEEESTP